MPALSARYHMILFMSTLYYELGDKACTPITSPGFLTSHFPYQRLIWHSAGPVPMNSFYSSLYRSEFPSDNTDMDNFLDKFEFPALCQAASSVLDRPLSIHGTMDMLNNKAPWPGWVLCTILFSSKLVPLLYSVYTEPLANGS